MFAKSTFECLNSIVKNYVSSIKKKLIATQSLEEKQSIKNRSTDINILLNRVKSDQKKEKKKKIYFSALASTGLFLFGLLIFN